MCMIQQGYKCVSPCLLPRLTVFELKISNILKVTYNILKVTYNILKSSGWELKKSDLSWEQNFFIVVGVFPEGQSAFQMSMVYTANWSR